MTGYGRAGFTLGGEDGAGYFVEAKSLNHRNLEIKVRLPERFSPLEMRIREFVKDRFSRGAFFLTVSASEEGRARMKLNLPLASAYIDASHELKQRLGLKEGSLDLQFLMGLKDIFGAPSGAGADGEKDWQGLRQGLEGALSGLGEMREKEGAALREAVEERLGVIDGFVGGIKARVPEVVEAYRAKLLDEIRRLVGEGAVDESRVVTEAALFAERTDVAEETVRLLSHLAQMRRYLKMEEPVGRRLDFLCQEVLREANTIGSKSQDVGISQTVVEVKGELEKIREQVQNIE